MTANTQAAMRISSLAALVAAAIILYGCPDDSSLTNCSSRNQPQHYDKSKGEWTCKK